TCTISVLERSGYSGVPWLSVARRGMDCGVLASAKWASQGSRTRRAPVWKLANWQTASELANGASSHTVVSKSASVMRMAAAVAMSGDGGARLVERLSGSAGPDMARITVLKTAWESWTASRKPACKVGSWERMGSILPAHEREKLHAGCGRLGSLIRALRVHAPHDGSDQHDLEPVAEARTLSERVDNGSKARPLKRAAKQICAAELARGEAHDGTRHRRFPSVEWRPIPAHAAAQHDESDVGLAHDLDCRQRCEPCQGRGKFRNACLRANAHQPLAIGRCAGRWRLLLIAVAWHGALAHRVVASSPAPPAILPPRPRPHPSPPTPPPP